MLFDAGTCTLGPTGNQNLVVAFGVEGDQAIGHGQDFAGAAVVVFQTHNLGLGPVVLEAENVRHVGATPRIDRLVIVADNTQIAVTQGQDVLIPLITDNVEPRCDVYDANYIRCFETVQFNAGYLKISNLPAGDFVAMIRDTQVGCG